MGVAVDRDDWAGVPSASRSRVIRDEDIDRDAGSPIDSEPTVVALASPSMRGASSGVTRSCSG